MGTISLVNAELDASQIATIYKTFVLSTPITFESDPP